MLIALKMTHIAANDAIYNAGPNVLSGLQVMLDEIKVLHSTYLIAFHFIQ